jgi:hypothetical protein
MERVMKWVLGLVLGLLLYGGTAGPARAEFDRCEHFCLQAICTSPVGDQPCMLGCYSVCFSNPYAPSVQQTCDGCHPDMKKALDAGKALRRLGEVKLQARTERPLTGEEIQASTAMLGK